MILILLYLQACYLTLVQQSSEVHHKSTVEMIYINAYNTLPLFLTMSLVLGEPAQVAQHIYPLQPGGIVMQNIMVVEAGWVVAVGKGKN